MTHPHMPANNGPACKGLRLRTILRTVRATCWVAALLGATPAISQAADCADPAVTSLSYDNVRSTVAGELVTYTFDLVATLKNEGSKDYAAATGAQSFDMIADAATVPLATIDFPSLGAGQSIELRSRVVNWSPLGGALKFVASIHLQAPTADCDLDNNTVSLDGEKLEQDLRGQ